MGGSTSSLTDYESKDKKVQEIAKEETPSKVGGQKADLFSKMKVKRDGTMMPSKDQICANYD